METINITPETKLQFEKERFMLRMKTGKIVSQDELVMMFIKHWRVKA